MRLCFRVFLVVSVCSLSTARASGEDEKKPSLLSRSLHLFQFGAHPKKAGVQARNLVLTMDLTPSPLKLSETRQLQVALALANHTNKLVHLEFPTTQRFEIILRDQAGKLVVQWSEDQSFTNDTGYVTVNPGERIEYGAQVSVRDLKPGQTYTVQGFFPNYEELKIQQAVVPQK